MIAVERTFHSSCLVGSREDVATPEPKLLPSRLRSRTMIRASRPSGTGAVLPTRLFDRTVLCGGAIRSRTRNHPAPGGTPMRNRMTMAALVLGAIVCCGSATPAMPKESAEKRAARPADTPERAQIKALDEQIRSLRAQYKSET